MIMKRQNMRSLIIICLTAIFSTTYPTLADVVTGRRMTFLITKVSAFLFVCSLAYTYTVVGFKSYCTHVVLHSFLSASLVVNSL